jgi:hypothetical protein
MTAFNKVKYYLGLDKNIPTDKYINLDKYGLGTKRTIKEFYDFAGIDIENKRVVKNFCNTDNIATNEDIIGSNKIKSQNNPITTLTSQSSYIFYYLISSVCIILILFIIYLYLMRSKL